MQESGPFEALVAALMRLPGIGRKTAQRLAFHLLRAPEAEVAALARSMLDVREKIRPCSTCGALGEADPCGFCTDPGRDRRIIVVVEEPGNVLNLERCHYRGLYHVLGGALSPLKGVGPEALRIQGLIERVRSGGVQEVILATNPTSEGEATAHYLLRLLKPLAVKVSRIAFGLPIGSELDYADDLTIGRALDGRREL